MQMQKSGLPAGKRVDIPFGVRAIQSGIEIDGIWISRPGTPVEIGQSSPSIASSSTLEPENKPKGKEKELPVHLSTTATEVEPTPEQTPQHSPAISFSERYTPTGVEARGHVRAFSLAAQPTYRPKGPSRHSTHVSSYETPDADALNRPERNSARRHHLQEVETYVPTNSFSSTESSGSSLQKTMVERSSTSSDEGLNHSNLRYVSNMRRSAAPSPRMLISFDTPEPATPTVDYFSMYDEHRRNPFETPSIADRVSRPPLSATRPAPHRSYSGESHVNTSSRRVNPGFEILPAGTFSRPDSQTDMEDNQPKRHSRNKIQKRNRRDQPSRETSTTR